MQGHDDGSKGQGAITYLKRIGVANLARTMAALGYAPAAVEAAGQFVGVEPATKRGRPIGRG